MSPQTPAQPVHPKRAARADTSKRAVHTGRGHGRGRRAAGAGQHTRASTGGAAHSGAGVPGASGGVHPRRPLVDAATDELALAGDVLSGVCGEEKTGHSVDTLVDLVESRCGMSLCPQL